MPRVTLETRTDWFPPDNDDDALDPEGSYSGKQRLTYVLGTVVPGMAAEIMTKLGFPTSADQVVVNYVKYHGKASANAPDINVILSPIWSEEREQRQEDMRGRLMTEIVSFLDSRLTPSGLRPQVDIEVLFLRGCGLSLKTDGTVSSSW